MRPRLIRRPFVSRNTTQNRPPPVPQGVFGNIRSIRFTDQDEALLQRAYATQNRPPPIPEGVLDNIRWNRPHPILSDNVPPSIPPSRSPPVTQGVFGNVRSIWFTDQDEALLQRAYATQNRPPPIPEGVLDNMRWNRGPHPVLSDNISQVIQVPPNTSPPVAQGVFGNIRSIWFTDQDEALLQRAYSTQNRPPPIPEGVLDHIHWSSRTRPIVSDEGRAPQVVRPHNAAPMWWVAPNASSIQGEKDIDMEVISDDMDTDPLEILPCHRHGLIFPEPMDVEPVVLSLIFPPTLPKPMHIDQPFKVEQHVVLMMSDEAKPIIDLDLNHGEPEVDPIPEKGNDQAVVLYNLDRDLAPSETADEETSPPTLPDPPVDLPGLVDDRCEFQPECDQMEQLTECFRLLDVRDDDDALRMADTCCSTSIIPVPSSSDDGVHNSSDVSDLEWLVEPILPPSPLLSYTDLLAEYRARKLKARNLDKLNVAEESSVTSSEIDAITIETSISASDTETDNTLTDATSTGSLHSAYTCLDTPCTRPASQTYILQAQESSPRPEIPCIPQKIEKSNKIIPCIRRFSGLYPTKSRRTHPEKIHYQRLRLPMADWESPTTITTQRDGSLEVPTSESLASSRSTNEHLTPLMETESSPRKASFLKSNDDPVFPGAYPIPELEESACGSNKLVKVWRPKCWIPWILGILCGW